MRISDWSSDVCSSDLQNVWMGVSTPGAADLAVRHEIGIDRFMWGSDYPHDESSHPYTREHLRSRLSGLAPAEVRKILPANAAQLYGFDLEALAPLAAQVGPAVAELATPIGEDRKSVVSGRRGSGRGDSGGRRPITKTK